MASISASVGRGGANHSRDVTTVQTLLNAQVGRLGLPPLRVDGQAGPKTMGAIVEFQRRVMSMHSPDGLVEPRGPTLVALTQPPATAPLAPKSMISLKGEKVPAAAEKVLKEILQAAGLTSAHVNSVERTPSGQARAMYNLIINHGVQYCYNLYKDPGKKVAKVYEENSTKPRETVIALMEAKINELGPSTVSKHTSSTHYVVDIDPGSITNKEAFIKAINAHKAVSKLLKPPEDPVYHIEIPRNSPYL
jgi:peptidoglycan hydrolase-like protein with peptidoglycan-binding domain